MAHQNYLMLIEMKKAIIKYLEGQKLICEHALKAYEPQPIQDDNEQIRIMREKEAIKLRDRISELSRHIAVIDAMFPDPE